MLKTFGRRAVFSAALLGMAFGADSLAAQQFVNGSLTGPIANTAVPAGWTVLNETPDTVDPNNNVGVPGAVDFAATASFSPNGGTWVGLGREGPTFVERFGQTLAGLSVGQSYTVSWYASNFGYNGVFPAYNNTNFFEMLLNGSVVGAGASVVSGPGWFAQSASFVATSANDQIAFQLGGNNGRAYMGIDGISLSRTSTVVPEPGSLALVAVGLGVVGFVRRKRVA